MRKALSFRVINVCAIMSTGFEIDAQKVSKDPSFEVEGPYDNRVRIKPPGATRFVTFFYNGKMVTIGNRTIAEARKNLKETKKYLKQFRTVKGERNMSDKVRGSR